MPKVFSWAKKLTGRSPGKDAGQCKEAGQGQESKEESESAPNPGSKQSPKKKSKTANENSLENHNDSNTKPSPEKKMIADQGSSPEKSLNPLRRFSPEKRHNSDRRLSSERKPSPEKRHHSDRRPSPEKRLSPEKKTSGFAKRFASFRILSLDRKSPDKTSRSKSKSPDPDLKTERGSPEKVNKNEAHSDPQKLPSPIREHTVLSKTEEEEAETTKDCDVEIEKNKEAASATVRISPESQDHPNSKDPNIDKQNAPEITPNSDKSIDPRISIAPGRQSISERLYGEVIKEFDKIRITKSKTTSATCVEDSNGGLDEKIQSDQEDNQNSCIPDKENSEDSVNKCLNNNLKNSRFRVSAVSEQEAREKLFSKNKIEDDMVHKKEENINGSSNSQGLPGQSSLPLDSSEHSLKNGNHNLKEDCNYSSLKVVPKRVPLVSPEASDTDVSGDESNDKIPVPSRAVVSQDTLVTVTNHDDLSKNEESSKYSFPQALVKESSAVMHQSAADGFVMEHNSNKVDKPVEDSITTLPHSPPLVNDLSKENIGTVISVASISLKSKDESPPKDSENHHEVSEEPLPPSFDDSAETNIRPSNSLSNMSPHRKSKISVSSSAPGISDEAQKKVNEALQSPNCKEHIHNEEEEVLHPPAPNELIIHEDSIPDDLRSSPSPSPIIQARSPTKSDSCETEVTPNDLSESPKITESELSLSKREEAPILPDCPFTNETSSNEITSTNMYYPPAPNELIIHEDSIPDDLPSSPSPSPIIQASSPTKRDSCETEVIPNDLSESPKITESELSSSKREEAPILPDCPLTNETSSNEVTSTNMYYPSSLENLEEKEKQPEEEIAEGENQSKNVNSDQELSTNSQAGNNELHSSLIPCPVEVTTISEETEPCTTTSDVVPKETIIENEVKFKEEILALLDKSFDNRRKSSANDADPQDSLKHNIDVEDDQDDVNGLPSDIQKNDVFAPTSVPVSLNSSFDASSVDGKRILPVPRRRVSLSRVNGSTKDSEMDLKRDLTFRETSSQPTSMSILNTNVKVDSKFSLNESYGELSSEGGGSLPASPSVPRRKKKSHPVPMTRSYHTLNTRSGRSPKDKALGNLPDKTPPPRPPMPLDIHNESPLQEPVFPVSPHIQESNLRHSTPNKDFNTSTNGNISIDEKSIKSQRKPVPKARTKVSLNPFDSDDEVSSYEQELPKSSKESFNPFDSEEDQEEEKANTQTADRRKPLSPDGYNPFDDEEEKENEDSFQVTSDKKVAYHIQSGRLCASSGKLNDSFTSLPSQTSNVADETASTNPFDDEEEDEEENSSFSTMSLTREYMGRQSMAVKGSSSFQRDGVRASLPSSGRLVLNKRKRQAPLPPGYRPPYTSSASTTPLPPRSRTALWRGESSTSLNQSPLRRDSTTSCSTLSLSSPRRAPPPRPPPPKVKSVSLAQLK